MANQEPEPDVKMPHPESEQARVERIRVAERRSHAERTMEELRARFGVDE